MPFGADGCGLYVALALAAAAAVMSAAPKTGAALQEFQSLLLASVAPEADATAGAVGANPDFPVSP